MANLIKGRDLTGERFGTLTVLRFDDCGSKQKRWMCLCDCGSVTSIFQHSLVTWNTKKCKDHPKNEYYVRDGYAEIDVSTDKFPNTFTKVDIDDVDMLKTYRFGKRGRLRWMVYNSSYGRWGSYVSATDRKTLLHRVITGVDTRDLIVDHINGDTLDNRKSNLQVITRAENNKNMRRHADNTSGHAGVHLKDGLWVACIQHNHKKHYLGAHDTKAEASAAYRAAAKVLGFSERHGT